MGYYSGLGVGDKSMQGLRGLLRLLDRLSERPDVEKILVGTTNDSSVHRFPFSSCISLSNFFIFRQVHTFEEDELSRAKVSIMLTERRRGFLCFIFRMFHGNRTQTFRFKAIPH